MLPENGLSGPDPIRISPVQVIKTRSSVGSNRIIRDNNGTMNAPAPINVRPIDYRPLSLSLLLHALLLVLLASWLVGNRPGTPGDQIRRGAVVLAVTNPDQTAEYLDEADVAETQPAADGSLSPDVAAEPPPPLDQPLPDDLPGMAPVQSVDAGQLADVPQNRFPNQKVELSKDDLAAIAREQRELANQAAPGPEATVHVFGSGELTGRRFVFVIDRSKSMGSQGLGVLNRAEVELSAAINQLEPHHQFQIVAYNDRTITIARRAMLPATEENKRRVPAFLGELVALGPTQHYSGLVAAIAFQPDVVVLMTDGGYPQLNGNQLHEIQLMTRGRVQIHALQFGSGPLQQRENFMMRLARENDGTYQYIDVNQWRESP